MLMVADGLSQFVGIVVLFYFDLNIARIACMLVLGRGLIFIFS